MTAAAVLGKAQRAQHRGLCIASYARLATFETIELLFLFIEHLRSKHDGYIVETEYPTVDYGHWVAGRIGISRNKMTKIEAGK